MSGPRNSTTSANGSRTYRWGSDVYDSVTTILSGGVPKPALVNWAAKSVAEFATANVDLIVRTINEAGEAAAIDLLKGSPYRNRDAAAAKGSAVHAAAEAIALGLPADESIGQGYIDAYRAWVADFSPTYLMSEASVYNRQYRYAGTLDMIVDVPGHGLLLADIKTGKGVYSETGLQLAAYRHAEFIGLPDGTEEPMPEVVGCAVLHLKATGYDFLPIEAGTEEFKTFLRAAAVRAFCARRDVIGSPLVPGKGEV